MASPQHPFTKEQIAHFQKAVIADYLAKDTPLLSILRNPSRREDTFRIPRPWSWHIRRFWDRLLKRIGLRKREPVTISLSQITITRDFKR
jgi:hypothetical protein